MDTFQDFRAAADSCRRLASGMANPDEARKLMTLATEFDALAEAENAAGSAANATRSHRKG